MGIALDLTAGEERLGKFINDVEATTSIKVSSGDDNTGANAPVDLPVENVEDNAINDEKLDQDIQDTTDDIGEAAEGAERLMNMYGQVYEFKKHIKKYNLSKDTYAFMDHTTGYRALAGANGFVVPSLDGFTNTASNKTAIMEANDGLLKRMKDGIVNFFKMIWANLTKFGKFLATKLEQAWSGIKQLGTAIKNIPANIKSGLKLKVDPLGWAVDQFPDLMEKIKQNILKAKSQSNTISESPGAFYAMIDEAFKDVLDAASKQSGQETEISAVDAEKILDAADKALANKAATLAVVEDLKQTVDTVAKTVASTSEPDQTKVGAFKRIGALINRGISAIGSLWSKLITFATSIGNKFMALFKKSQADNNASAPAATPA